MWDCDGSSRQQWLFVPSFSSGGLTYGEIRILNTEFCLDLDNGATSFNGATLQVWACAGTPNQLWAFNSVTETEFELLNYKAVSSGQTACVDIQDFNSANDATVQSWSCAGSLNQQWNLNSQGQLQSPQSVGRCMTAAGPLVRNVAFLTPTDNVVVVVMNESLEPVSFQLQQGDLVAETQIPARAIQTYIYSNPVMN